MNGPSGFLELLAMLLSLGGFGVNANPKAPAGAEVLHYAPATYDVMFYADLEAVVPRNYKALTELPKQPAMQANPEAVQMVKRVIREVETARAAAQAAAGFNPVTDIESLTVWVKFNGQNDPDVLAVVRGKLPVDQLKAMASMGLPPNMAVDRGNKGELLVGTKTLVTPRASKAWRPKKPSAEALALFKRKPFLAAISTVSPDTAAMVGKEFDSVDNVLTDLVSGHDFAGFYMAHDGGGWSWHAKSRQGYQRAVMASEGIIELLRAGHLGSRGMAHLGLAAVESYRGKDPTVDAIIKHKAELLAVLMSVTGDGKFRDRVKRQANRKSISVDLTGRRVTDVFPIAGFLPIAGAWLFVAQPHEAPPAVHAEHEGSMAIEKPQPVSGADRLRVRDTYRNARARHGQ